MRRIAGIALTLAVAGCGWLTEPGGRVSLSSPGEVVLHVGQEALVDGRFHVAVQGVPSDSRCPMTADCIWAGDAAVAITSSVGTGPSSPDTVHTTLQPSSVARAGYGITLVQVTPYPAAPGPIPESQYAVRLRIAPIVPLPAPPD